MKTVTFELTGTTALLMHMDDVERSDEVKAWAKDPRNKNASVAGDDRTPAWTWQGYTYHDGEHVAMPAENLMVCLRQAGAQIVFKRQKTFKELTQSGLAITSEFLEFSTHGERIPVSFLAEIRDLPFIEQQDRCRDYFEPGVGFRLFVKRARVGASKHVRVRPRFDDWKVRGRIVVMNAAITDEVLRQLFEIAENVGLGDWRPGCKTPGAYGRFSAKLIF